MRLLITRADLPGADLAADVRLSAGLGWLPLVREALADLEGLKILAIREDAGALVIDTTRCSETQRGRMAEIRAASLHVCELCGLPGELVYDGVKDGRPAGWHRTRCVAHRDWRTCPPFLPGQARGLLDSETEAAARRFLSLIADRYNIAGALLYGSRARGTHRPDSDVDLAVILRGEPQPVLPTTLEMSDVAYDVLLETGINISPLPVWLDEWMRSETHSNPALLRNIAAEGIPVAPSDSTAIRLKKVVLCDVCDASTAETGHGVLQAQWSDGEAEGMRLCKSCFDFTMSTLKRERWVLHMFDDDEPEREEKE